MGSTPRRSKLDVASHSPRLEVHCKALLFFITLQRHDAMHRHFYSHGRGLRFGTRLGARANAYSGRSQSVRLSPSSSHSVGRALRPAAARAASGSPPNSGRPPGRCTFTARLRWKQSYPSLRNRVKTCGPPMTATVPELRLSAPHAASKEAPAGFQSRAFELSGSAARPATWRGTMSRRRLLPFRWTPPVLRPVTRTP